MEERLSDDQRQKMSQIMTTEHSVLQAGRSATIFETGGRTAVFLGTVSSALIALAFVGQISGLGTAFFAFALVLLPTLFFLGLASFERAMQLGVEDYIYAVGMSRIRHLYVETVPQAEKYFVGSIHDDFATTMAPTAFGMPVTLAWQSLLTVSGAIGKGQGRGRARRGAGTLRPHRDLPPAAYDRPDHAPGEHPVCPGRKLRRRPRAGRDRPRRFAFDNGVPAGHAQGVRPIGGDRGDGHEPGHDRRHDGVLAAS
jgi:hypothetical protein